MMRAMMGKNKIDKNTKLLLHFDGDVRDAANSFQPVVSDSNYGIGKFGQAKYRGYIDIPNSAYLFKLPEFSVDFWLKLDAYNGNGYGNQVASPVSVNGDHVWRNGLFVISGNNDAPGNGTVCVDGVLCLYSDPKGATHGDAGVIKLNTWYHIYYYKNANTVAIFVGGKEQIRIDNYATNQASINKMTVIRLMKAYELTYQMYGYMDEFRISDRVRWRSDFIPPTKPY